ncbi:hypothetical protein GLOIN_2v1666337, partial [Rhizophagus irregularis DAOM 181602=DAOM 197198]
LRYVLLEGVPVQWNKKCIKYVETQEGVWYEKLPELQIVDYGITHISANVSVPQHLMDKANKIHENFLVRKTLGTKEDSTLMMTRLIPIKQEQNDEKSEPHYRVTLVYSYPFELDNVDVESDKVKVDDNDPASVIEHVKRLIRTLRPDCELTDLLIEFWDLIPKTIPNDPIKMMRDIDHVYQIMDNPILGLGANNAIQDVDKLSQALLKCTDCNISFIEEYEKEMLKRTSADILKSRTATFKTSIPLGPFGIIIRDSILKVINAMINFYSFADNIIFKD